MANNKEISIEMITQITNHSPVLESAHYVYKDMHIVIYIRSRHTHDDVCRIIWIIVDLIIQNKC